MADAPHEEPDVLRRLELAVARALDRIAALEAQLREADRRGADLDQVLFDITGGDLRPTVLVDSLRALEAENEELKKRLAGGREGVERLLAKIRFVEGQR